MNASEFKQSLRQQLSQLYSEREAGNIAEMVLENITGRTRVDRLINDPALSEEMLEHGYQAQKG